MDIGSVTLIFVGLFVLYFSFMLGIKKKISIMHDYHYKNVKEEQIDLYCKIMAFGLLIMSLSLLINACLMVCFQSDNVVILMLGMVTSIGIMIYGQYKYNGSIMS